MPLIRQHVPILRRWHLVVPGFAVLLDSPALQMELHAAYIRPVQIALAAFETVRRQRPHHPLRQLGGGVEAASDVHYGLTRVEPSVARGGNS